MKPRTAFVKWTVLGTIVAIVLVIAQSLEVGGPAGLLQVGETSALRPLIEGELAEVPLVADGGHDGQIFYGIALDLSGSEVPELLDNGAYRYRRVFYPLVSSLGGLLDGVWLLHSMIVVAVLSFGVAAGAIAAVAAGFNRTDWWALAVVLNPGMWLSVRLLTSDATAVAMLSVALYGLVAGWRLASLWFAASGLSKDLFLLTPAGLQLDRRTRSWSILLVPSVTLALWAFYLTATMGEGFTGRGNLAWPFQGVVDASSNWSNLARSDLFYLLFALGAVALGLGYGLMRKGWMRWPVLGWAVLAIVSSDWVWDFGNNAARAFGPIVILVAVGLVTTERDVPNGSIPPWNLTNA